MAIYLGTNSNDKLIGQDGDDELYGFDGDDYLDGRYGFDLIDGGAGNDTVSYAFYNRTITLSLITGAVSFPGNATRTDTLVSIENVYSGYGSDYIYGDDGDNYIDSDFGSQSTINGNDTVYGGGGNDHINGGWGFDYLDGGSGFDIVDYSFFDDSNGTIIDFLQQKVIFSPNYSAGGDRDIIIGFEGFICGGGDDKIVGDNNENWIYGRNGNDVIDGGSNIDTAAYTGKVSEYNIVNNPDGSATITDLVDKRDGTDTLKNIERIQFSDTIDWLSQVTVDDYADQASDSSAPIGAITLASPLTGFIGPADADDTYGDKDVFKVSLSQGQSYLIHLQGTAINGQTLPQGIFTVRDPGNFDSVLATSSTGADITFNFTPSTSGDYFIRVGSGGLASDQGGYQLTVSSITPTDQTAQSLFDSYRFAPDNGQYYGYYKTFFDLSAASYVLTGFAPGMEVNHDGAILQADDSYVLSDGTHVTVEGKSPSISIEGYERLLGNGMQLISETDLITADSGFLPSAGVVGSGTTKAVWLGGERSQDYQYKFKDGFYDAYETSEIVNSSVALVGRTQDALFLTFRGTNGLGDWADDFGAMDEHYQRYEPLFDVLDQYIANNGIHKVFVSGHSLGGQMASMYMADANHQLANVTYQAVTFEAANKHVPFKDMFEYYQDGRLINFEMNMDPVPDLWPDNYGKSIHLDTEGDIAFAVSHRMINIKPAFEQALPAIDNALPLADHTRIYVDSNGDGELSTRLGSLMLLGGVDKIGPLLKYGKVLVDPAAMDALLNGQPDTAWMLAAAAEFLPIVGTAVAGVSLLTGIFDEVEYQWTGYDVKTAVAPTGDRSLTIDSLWLYLGGQKTFMIDDPNLRKVTISNTIPYVGFLAPDVNVDGHKAAGSLDLQGNGGSNQLMGSLFADIINGGGGADTMIGLGGNDVYFQNRIKDIIDEGANTDTYDAVIITDETGDFFDCNSYSLAAGVEICVAKDDKFTASENFNIYANGGDAHYLIGNAGNNKIIGGSGSDLLVGGGDVDLLVGGAGNDVLFGGVYNYGLTEFGPLPNEVSQLVGQYADARPFDSVDVGFYVGGWGADILIGEKSEADYNTTEANFTSDDDGDNDYFFIDVKPNGNAGNVDSIRNFYVAGSDSSADDWLVFSAQELGLDFAEYADFAREKIPFYFNDLPLFSSLPIWKAGNTGNDLNGYVLPFKIFSDYEEHFFKIDGIENYHAGTAYLNDQDYFTFLKDDLADSLFAFVLDTSNGDLYFDRDGNRDYDDTIKVANISPHQHGDILADLHANQIIILPDFNFIPDSFNGIVSDGHIAGTEIFIDTNDNGLADVGESSGVFTYASGGFSLANVPIHALIAVGGTNIDTGLENHLVMTAPYGSTVINPLTTLVQLYATHNQVDKETAQTQVKTALGLSATLDLTYFDPLSQPTSDPTALQTQKTAVQLAVLGNAAQANGSSFAGVATALANAINVGEIIDLTDNATVQATVGGVLSAAEVKEVCVINRVIAGVESLEAVADIQSIQGAGGDIWLGDAGNNSHDGTLLDDILQSLAGNDVLNGLAGNDQLNGGTGIDILAGGLGDDVYVVDHVKDKIIELAGQGMDTVEANITYSLGKYLENLTLTGSTFINGKGNNLGNLLTGNSGINKLDGGLGNDTLDGGAGNDNLTGGSGDDLFLSGLGDDFFNGGGGIDTVSFAALRNGVNVNLLLRGNQNTGAGNDKFTAIEKIIGSDFADQLTGSTRNDLLQGGAGNDILNGSKGKDSLIGGNGADGFYFDINPATNNVDTVQDFSHGVDKVWLDDAAFRNIGITGQLADNDDRFRASGIAADRGDRILYDNVSGALYFDADGNGGGKAVQIALLANHPDLTASDIWVL